MTRALLSFAVLLAASGCSEPRTMADPILPEWQVAAEPELELGGEDDPGGPLHRVRGLARLGDRILVVNAGTHSVRLHASDGTLVSSFGREGGGSGEFQDPRLVGRLSGDSLIIHDPRNQRLSVICDGSHVCAESPLATRGDVLGIAGDFAFVQRYQAAPIGEPLARDSFHYFLARLDDSSVDTIAVMDGAPRQGSSVGGRWVSFPVPLSGGPSAAVAESVLVLSTGRDAALRVFDLQGLERPSITLPISLEPITASAFRGVIENIIERFPEREQAGARRFFEAMSPPAHYPVIGRILVDRTGLIWAERWHTDPTLHTWLVVDPHGRVQAEVTTPPGLTVDEIGVDYVLGVWRDPLDIEYVRMHALSRQ